MGGSSRVELQKQDQDQNLPGERARPHRSVVSTLARLRASLFGEEVVEGFYGVEFVVFDVEDGVELGDIEDVLDFLGEA